MDSLNEKVKTIYFKFLTASFGSAMITSIYSIVDMAMLGKYYGPSGVAVLAIITPVWNIIYSLGLLMGVGGSVIFSIKRGLNESIVINGGKKSNTDNRYFTISVIGAIVLSILAWIFAYCLEDKILYFFCANDELLILAKQYLEPIKFVFPTFLLNQMLMAFLRNDKIPTLAMILVLSGGIFNFFGDYFFVFIVNMGAYGARLATDIGSTIFFLFSYPIFCEKKFIKNCISKKVYSSN